MKKLRLICLELRLYFCMVILWNKCMRTERVIIYSSVAYNTCFTSQCMYVTVQTYTLQPVPPCPVNICVPTTRYMSIIIQPNPVSPSGNVNTKNCTVKSASVLMTATLCRNEISSQSELYRDIVTSLGRKQISLRKDSYEELGEIPITNGSF